MAELTNKLHLKKNDVVFDCVCYTTADEATPVAISGGNSWEIKNNGVVCYVGLWPVSEGGGEFHSPLKVKKNDVEYFVETQVARMTMVNIVQSEHQTIKVTYNGAIYTDSFEAIIGTQFSVVVEPEVGYTAGAPSVSAGYVTKDLVITASPASKAQYLVTIEQTSGQTIIVTCNGVEYTSSFTAEYGDTWTAVVVPDEYYTAGALKQESGTITSNCTISAYEAEREMFALATTMLDNAYFTVNGIAGDTFSIGGGTTVNLESVEDQYYTTDAMYLDVARLIVYTIDSNIDMSLISNIVVESSVGGPQTFDVSELNEQRELNIWTVSIGDITIKTNCISGYTCQPISVDNGADTVYVTVDTIIRSNTKEIVLAPPFTENVNYLDNLVDGDLVNLNREEAGGISLGTMSMRNDNVINGYIEFKTPINADDIFVSIAVIGDDWVGSMVLGVYIGPEIYYPSSDSDIEEGITDGKGVYIINEYVGTTEYHTYTLPSNANLQPDSIYYMTFTAFPSRQILNIKEIKFNIGEDI